jgi:5-formyltetrahydrofolate cyclo-ligase
VTPDRDSDARRASSVAAKKAALRSQLRDARKAASPAPMIDQVFHAVKAFGISPGQAICAYAPTRYEPGSIGMLDALKTAGFQVLLPVVVPDSVLEWAEYDKNTLRPGLYGLREPMGPLLGSQALSLATLALVPALAVDCSGVRLGQGGGHYDRSLHLARAPIVAMVREEELLERLPCQSHDIRVDAALTPSRLVSLPMR